jgi:hypothetical protein
MINRLLLLAVCLSISFQLGIQKANAQDDKLTYVLEIAKVELDVDPSGKTIAVRFAKSLPAGEAANLASNWRVIAIDVNGDTKSYQPQSANVVPGLSQLVLLRMQSTLEPGGELDRTTHKIIIRYQQQNLPSVTLGAVYKKKGAEKAFTAAKGKKDADIYLSGSATGQRGSGPVYSIEAQAGYLHSLRRAGSIGGKATFVSDSGSEIDPDSITLAATYQKVFVLRSPTGIILNSDFLGGEFDKKNSTRNLTTELDGTLVLPSARLGDNTFATMDFMGGFEAGHNYKHPLNPKGLGAFWRPKFGINAYLVALAPPRVFNRINLSANYLLRLPQSAEPFTEKINGSEVASFSKRPRHHFGMDLGLMLAPAYGFTISYRYGSLPPAFSLVDHKVSAGFTLQLKQANK